MAMYQEVITSVDDLEEANALANSAEAWKSSSTSTLPVIVSGNGKDVTVSQFRKYSPSTSYLKLSFLLALIV